jgi:hypothetical protein
VGDELVGPRVRVGAGEGKRLAVLINVVQAHSLEGTHQAVEAIDLVEATEQPALGQRGGAEENGRAVVRSLRLALGGRSFENGHRVLEHDPSPVLKLESL